MKNKKKNFKKGYFKELNKEKINAGIGILAILVLFILVSYIVQSNLEYFNNMFGKSFLWMILYVLIVIISIVLAPVSSVPLLPIASLTWGWFIAGVLSIIGWVIGAVFAFILSRKYGVPLVSRFIPFKKINEFERKFPKENLFWSIVFLRMAMPVDVLSYILGLFTCIKFRTYFFATIIGVTPFGFVLAYLGTLSLYYQLIFFIVSMTILLMGYYIKNKGK